MGNVQIIKKSSPIWVGIENHVDKAHNLACPNRDHGEAIIPGLRQTVTPNPQPLNDDFAVEERIETGTPIVPPPAISMKNCDSLCILPGGVAIKDFGFIGQS